MMQGKAKPQEPLRLYEAAAACEPADATERLDVELAKSELSDRRAAGWRAADKPGSVG
jgi:hypothetical protein